jgi:hypothetical protein
MDPSIRDLSFQPHPERSKMSCVNIVDKEEGLVDIKFFFKFSDIILNKGFSIKVLYKCFL